MDHTEGRQKMSYSELKEAAVGKWPFIFQDLVPELVEAMGAAPGEHVPCPIHGGTNGFRLFDDYPSTGGGICNTCHNRANGFAATGFTMIAWLRGYGFEDAKKDVAEWMKVESYTPRERAPLPIVTRAPIDPAKAQAQIRRIWTTTEDLKGSVAEEYLKDRGIWTENQPRSLRFHPGLEYFDQTTKSVLGRFPAMVAPVTDPRGNIVALHRTFLSQEGKKAPVPEVKKLTMKAADSLNGSAIKLFASGDVLGVAEGIETALAAYAISRIPVWSCVNAPLMESLEVPDSVRHIVIWADKDMKHRGQQAADFLAERMVALGKTVEILMPPGRIPEGAKGIDWLDVLLTQGIPGFPIRWRNWKPDARLAG